MELRYPCPPIRIMLNFNIRGKLHFACIASHARYYRAPPRKTGAGLPKGRMLRPPVSAFPPDPGLRVRGNLRGGPASATPPKSLRAPWNHDGSLRAPATMTRGYRAASTTRQGLRAPTPCDAGEEEHRSRVFRHRLRLKEGARSLHHAGAIRSPYGMSGAVKACQRRPSKPPENSHD